MTTRIDIARDFSRAPAGRFKADGKASGQRFREDILIPALNAGKVDVVIDGVAGLPSSFLEEAMGGLIRHGFALAVLEDRLRIIAETPRMAGYAAQAWRYIRDAAGRLTNAPAA